MKFDPYAEAEAIVRLTPLQQAMLAHTKLAGGGAYVGQMSARLRGALDPERVEAVFQRLVDRHAALRTLFVTEDLEEPLQIVQTTARLRVRIEDFSHDADAETRLADFLATDSVTPFDLLRPPLMRVALFRLAENVWHLVLTRHHLVMDGMSAVILFDELEDLIGGVEPPAATPFYRFIDWLDGRDAAARAYWGDALRGAGAGSALFPSERLARGETPAALTEIIRPLDEALIARAATTARDLGVTAQTIYAGAWALLAARYARDRVAQFGMTVAGRPDDVPGAAGSVGLFVDTLPMRIPVDDESVVGVWLERLQRQLAEASGHAHFGLHAQKRAAALPPDIELFSHILVLESYGQRGISAPERSLAIESYRFVDQTNFALNVGVVSDRGVRLAAVFDPTRLEGPAIERMLANFESAIRSLAERPGAHLGEIDILAAGETESLRAIASGGEAFPSLAGSALPARLAASVMRRRDQIAVTSAGESLTYGALWGEAGKVAAALQKRGPGCDRLVGLCLRRSLEQVIAMIGVIRAGGAFAPLDPDDPEERRAAMAEDAHLDLVLCLDDVVAMRAGPHADPAIPDLRGDAAAYALFTSGSTGRPKAALNAQAAVLNRLDWMQAAYPIGADDRVLQKTASTFDVSVWEFLWPLLNGARLALAGPDAHRDPSAILDAVRAEAITVLHLVPSMLRLFLRLDGVEGCTSLRHLFVSGEALDPDLPALLRARLPHVALHNLYGPAEAAIDVTFQETASLRAEEPVPIGAPIPGATILLLERGCRLAPRGAIGEIAIGGVAVGRGYVGRPELTAERFIPDPWARAPGARLYRTGDLARWDEAGRLMFHGRADDQVKLRGQRIELGEIETALRSLVGVADAAVAVENAGRVEAALIAYVVPTHASASDDALIERLRANLRRLLPPALIPTQWRRLDALPRLASGKLDRKALVARMTTTRRHITPRNEEEALLAAAWAEALGRAEIGVTDDFFALGGHSIVLVRLANLIQRDFGVSVELAELFDATTIEQQLTLILEKLLATADPALAAQLLCDVEELERD